MSRTFIVRAALHLLLSTVMLGSGLPLIALAQEYVPPNRGLPGRREGGGTRGNCLRANTTPLVALAPDTNFGTTLKPYPTFFWYVPQGTTQTAEFVLLDDEDNEVYATTLQITDSPGVVSVSIPETVDGAALEVGRDYHWYFSIICDPQDRSGDIFAEGWIQRIAPPPGLINRLARANESDRPAIYAQMGIWYDALQSLAKLRQSEPANPDILLQWTTLLRSVGLETLASQPLVSCCNPCASVLMNSAHQPPRNQP